MDVAACQQFAHFRIIPPVSLCPSISLSLYLYLYLLRLGSLPADARVGRQLFDNCICGLLRGKTRVLVTHQLQFLSDADLIVVLSRGKVSHQGVYHELAVSGGPLEAVCDRPLEPLDMDALPMEFGATPLISVMSQQQQQQQQQPRQSPVAASPSPRTPLAQPDDATVETLKLDGDEKPKGLTVAEESAQGNVTWSTYSDYLRAGAGRAVPVFVFVYMFVCMGVVLFTTWWLSRWSQVSHAHQRDVYNYGTFIGLAFLTVQPCCVCS